MKIINKDPFALVFRLPAWAWKVINIIPKMLHEDKYPKGDVKYWSYSGFGGVWPFVLYQKDKAPYEQGVIIHELEHIKQQVKEPFTFHFKYLRFQRKVGYKKNPYEVEARKVQAEYYRKYRKGLL